MKFADTKTVLYLTMLILPNIFFCTLQINIFYCDTTEYWFNKYVSLLLIFYILNNYIFIANTYLLLPMNILIEQIFLLWKKYNFIANK